MTEADGFLGGGWKRLGRNCIGYCGEFACLETVVRRKVKLRSALRPMSWRDRRKAGGCAGQATLATPPAASEQNNARVFEAQQNAVDPGQHLLHV